MECLIHGNIPCGCLPQQELKKAIKFDQDKLRFDLLPVLALEEVTKVFTYGAKKYADRNWEKGFLWSRPYGACLRHIFAFWRGEDNDPESGLSHLAHAICCLLFIVEFGIRHTGTDDRPYQKNLNDQLIEEENKKRCWYCGHGYSVENPAVLSCDKSGTLRYFHSFCRGI